MNKKQMRLDWKDVAGDLIFKIIMAALIISSINYFLNSIDRAINTSVSTYIITILKMIVSVLSFLGISIGITNLIHNDIRFSTFSIFEGLKRKNFNTFKNFIDILVLKMLIVGISLIPAAVLYYKYNGSGINALYTLLYIYNVDRLMLVIAIILPTVVYFYMNLYLSFVIQSSIVYPKNSYKQNRELSKQIISDKEVLFLIIRKSIKYYLLALATSLIFVSLTTYFMGISFKGLNLLDILLRSSEGGFNPKHFLPKVSYMMNIVFVPILILILANKTAEIDFIKAYILNNRYVEDKDE